VSKRGLALYTTKIAVLQPETFRFVSLKELRRPSDYFFVEILDQYSQQNVFSLHIHLTIRYHFDFPAIPTASVCFFMLVIDDNLLDNLKMKLAL
jgi:hypothetical protein